MIKCFEFVVVADEVNFVVPTLNFLVLKLRIRCLNDLFPELVEISWIIEWSSFRRMS